jgi:hypothetical protein
MTILNCGDRDRIAAVLNTLTKHDFQDAFKKWQKGWEQSIVRKATISRVMVAIRPKVFFEQMAAPYQEIMDTK